ncbi:MAG TPA: serine/threonine-protein kinase [Povalibacter sp.]|uniref:CHASE2 domain-containing serine/threonine-protein kinase n=1 Tax=Povalibacter sp. TaxID=1962978 RepID=UPI002C272937|nr:serine/threonine-protein kinase [Povalibacter sp.]HMN43409.1 serine/threonine-protein kinase [Povalibacter sp.]
MASRLARYSWLPGGIAASAVIAIGALLAPSPFTPLELAAYDRAQRASATPDAQDIVLIDIDDRSIAELGTWPWPHNVHADLLRELHEARARIVAFTMPLSAAPTGTETERVRAALALLEASNLGDSAQAMQLRELLRAGGNSVDPEGQLAAAMKMHGNVLLPIEVRIEDGAPGNATLPTQFLVAGSAEALQAALTAKVSQPLPAQLTGNASAIGHLHLDVDVDGVVRTDTAAVRIGNALLPSLATVIAAKALSSEITFDARDAAQVGTRSLPIEGALLTRPQYFAGTSPKLTHYSYVEVLNGEVPAAALRDRIVLVGVNDADRTFTTAAGPQASMNVITASAVNSILRDASFRHPGSSILAEWLVALAIILFAALILPAAGPGLGALATILVVAILGISEAGLLASTHLWVQLVVPAAAAIAGYALYALGEIVRRANVKPGAAPDPNSNLRTLGQTFQRQGQLDLAFETYRRCPLDAPTMELLYFLGMDFERRRQNQKAAAVYSHIATRDPNYRDLRARRARVTAEERPAREPAVEKPKAWPPTPAPRVEDWSEDPWGEQSPPSLGRKLGRYELERELGKGAMGVVYLGRDPNINRVVAIKAIPLADEFEEQDLEEARARFFREAEMAGRLNHPAIVTVYDAGEDQGLAYIAMEYLRGQHLSSYTDSAKLLPPKTVMTLVARTAEALHYAHRQNVVHRDIKPANIMFNAETDELKITDFGIARLTDTSRTKTGIVLGTPSFMSPEQLEGRNLDGRSDQFALGISLYQLLTGQLPFRAESMPRLMQKIATEPHTPIRLIRPELPDGIDAIIDRVLAKSADDRYPTCAEFAADLKACTRGMEPEKAPAGEHEWLIP